MPPPPPQKKKERNELEALSTLPFPMRGGGGGAVYVSKEFDKMLLKSKCHSKVL